MVTVKQTLNNLLETIPEFQLREVVDFAAILKNRSENPGGKGFTEKNLERASLSSMDFWDNAIDDEVWNNV